MFTYVEANNRAAALRRHYVTRHTPGRFRGCAVYLYGRGAYLLPLSCVYHGAPDAVRGQYDAAYGGGVKRGAYYFICPQPRAAPHCRQPRPHLSKRHDHNKRGGTRGMVSRLRHCRRDKRELFCVRRNDPHRLADTSGGYNRA
jgi:hypothetical protein